MAKDPSARLYSIDSYPIDFVAGYLPDGNQTLSGVLYPDLAVIEFDSHGTFLRVLTRPIPGELLELVNGIYRSDEDAVMDCLEQWRKELGIVPGKITVQRFSLPDLGVGIDDFPDDFDDVLSRPEFYGEESVQSVHEESARWQEQGNFVFWWGKDYYMSRDGEVEST